MKIYRFAPDCVLLVIERQGGPRDAADVEVITRRVGGGSYC